MLGSSTCPNWIGESTVCAGCDERDQAPQSITHYHNRPKQQLFLVDRHCDERPHSARLALTRRTGNAHGGSLCCPASGGANDDEQEKKNKQQ